jgi:molybdopterin converting factor small subunit
MDYGADLENFLIDEKTEKARAYLQIMVDGKYTSFLDRKKTTLRNGSVVTILPPIGGG